MLKSADCDKSASDGDTNLTACHCQDMKIRPVFRKHLITGDPAQCRKPLGLASYLIFVANITNQICGEKFVMWRNFRFICTRDVAKSEISPHVE